MGFSLVFSKPMAQKGGFLADGSKDPPLQRLSLHETAANCFWETNRVLERTKARTAARLSPDLDCLPHFTLALRRRFTSAADRPAGTREALPGTKSLAER